MVKRQWQALVPWVELAVGKQWGFFTWVSSSVSCCPLIYSSRISLALRCSVGCTCGHSSPLGFFHPQALLPVSLLQKSRYYWVEAQSLASGSAHVCWGWVWFPVALIVGLYLCCNHILLGNYCPASCLASRAALAFLQPLLPPQAVRVISWLYNSCSVPYISKFFRINRNMAPWPLTWPCVCQLANAPPSGHF
jgi:hypothetical protein